MNPFGFKGFSCFPQEIWVSCSLPKFRDAAYTCEAHTAPHSGGVCRSGTLPGRRCGCAAVSDIFHYGSGGSAEHFDCMRAGALASLQARDLLGAGRRKADVGAERCRRTDGSGGRAGKKRCPRSMRPLPAAQGAQEYRGENVYCDSVFDGNTTAVTGGAGGVSLSSPGTSSVRRGDLLLKCGNSVLQRYSFGRGASTMSDIEGPDRKKNGGTENRPPFFFAEFCHARCLFTRHRVFASTAGAPAAPHSTAAYRPTQ